MISAWQEYLSVTSRLNVTSQNIYVYNIVDLAFNSEQHAKNSHYCQVLARFKNNDGD